MSNIQFQQGKLQPIHGSLNRFIDEKAKIRTV